MFYTYGGKIYEHYTKEDLAQELLTIQMGSVDDAIDLFDNGGGTFSEEEEGAILELIEELGNTEPLID
jgi:hypothetical protein